MNVWNNAVFTDKGLALQSKMIAGQEMKITRAIAGAGFVTPGLLQSQTEVIDAKQELSFRPVVYPEYGKCRLSLYLTNDKVNTGYKARMIYVMANDPDEGEIIFFVAQSVSAEEGTTVPSATEMPGYSAEWAFTFQFGRADGVNVTVDPANTISRAEMEAALKVKADVDLSNVADSAFAEKAAKSGAGGTPVVPATSTDGVTYTATVNGIKSLTIGQPLIIVPNMTSTAVGVKLDVNGLGAKSLRMALSTTTGTTAEGPSDGWIVKGKPVAVMYDGLFFRSDITRPSASELYGITDVANGGTGAATPEEALKNLGAAPLSHVDDAVKHVSEGERAGWNSKADADHTHPASSIDGLPQNVALFAYN